MPKDFSGKNLRGRNFKGQDLTGAKFIGADIRGANFTNAILREADFTRAKAGLQRHWTIFLVTISLFLSVISGYISGFATYWVAVFLTVYNIKQFTIPPGVVVLIFLEIFFIATIYKGLGAGAVVGAVAAAGAAVVAVAGAVPGAMAGTVAMAAAAAAAVVMAVAVAAAGAEAAVGAAVVAVAGAVAGAVVATMAEVEAVAVGVAGAGAGAGIGICIAWLAMAGDEEHAFVRTVAIASATTGGTSFRNADLTDANFTEATLKSTDFRTANLTRTCFRNTEKLDRARVGNSILADTRVRKLLVTGNGYNKSYVGANLQGANLTGDVNLSYANLKQANLSEATLHQANLEFANLTETQALATDFTEAYFTGACLEAWNIDATTKLDRVNCRFVYLLEYPQPGTGDRERRPHHINKCFEPGDFEKLYKKIMETVQILIKDGLNPEAFTAAFQKLMQEFPDITPESIQGIEKKENDVLLTLKVPEETDKGKVEQIWDEVYQARLEAQIQAEQLKAKDEIIAIQKYYNHVFEGLVKAGYTKNSNLNELVKLLTPQPVNVKFINEVKSTSESKAMSDQIDQSRKIEITGGTVNASGAGALSLGDISGTVANTINQLSDSPKPDEPGIKELLTELQTAIEAETDLSDDDKAEALEQVKTLAEVGKNPQESTMQKAGKTAMKILKGTIAGLPTTATLLEACSKLLPMIAKLLPLA
ncbi:pentapeptide repeat-containing protein [Microcoleus sp. S13C4]|uniref:pentapeptide repeat-containing protein n=1 Tax=Microcoleus sp. S13C4 TaxID=3055410 RepID=UPI002FD5BCEC